jgi:phosphatidylserine/phosphatidylglycerophosphate/cardiolipin synthase-like enzyme
MNRLDALDQGQRRALLAYLNLPPVGALADTGAGALADGDARYELPGPLRRALAERRPTQGFGDVAELVAVPGFGPGELDQVCSRIADPVRYGNAMAPLWGGPEAMAELFALIESARHHVHVQMYIVGGQVGLRMAELLARKRAEGVQVRVMFTASGFVISGGPSGGGLVSKLSHLRSYLFNDMYVRKKIIRHLAAHDCALVDAAPIGRHWRRKVMRAQGVKNRRGYERWARDRGAPDAWLAEQDAIDAVVGRGVPNVDHRKMVLVDGDRAWVGSQNIADAYLYDNPLDADPRVNIKNWQWHDAAFRLDGPVVARLEQEFARRWQMSGGDVYDATERAYSPPPRAAGTAVVHVATSIPGMLTVPWKQNWGRLLLSMVGADRRPITAGRNPIRDRIVQLPELAGADFYAEHCYPSDADLLNHWAKVGAGIADFTMVVPQHYDTVLLGFECDRFYPEMLAAGIKLWGYRKAIIHSKTAVVDGFYTSTGSYNLTLRSARADIELQFFVQSAELGGAVRERIRGDLAESVPIEPSFIDRLRSRRSIPVVDALMRYLLL